MYQIIEILLLFSGLTIYMSDAILIIKPVDILAPVGSNISMNCSTNSTSQYGSFISWFNSSSCVRDILQFCTRYYDGTRVYGENVDRTRYSVTSIDTSTEHIRTLNINRVQLTDAGNYVCWDITTGETASAQLAVIDGLPSCTTNVTGNVLLNDIVQLICFANITGITSNAVFLTRNGTNFTSGNVTYVSWTSRARDLSGTAVTCTAGGRFNSSCPDIAVKPENVKINRTIDGCRVKKNDILTCSADGPSVITYQWTIQLASGSQDTAKGLHLTVRENMAGSVTFHCNASNEYGSTLTNCSGTVEVAVYNITISSNPKSGLYYAGDQLICHADGYPAPTYEWNLIDNSSIVMNGSVFTVQEDMVGTSYEWRCDATNTVFNIAYRTSRTINVTVANGTRSSDQSVEKPSGNNTAIIVGVVCGVGGAVLVIVLISLLVCCIRRQKHQKKPTDGHEAVITAGKKQQKTSTPARDKFGYTNVEKESNGNLSIPSNGNGTTVTDNSGNDNNKHQNDIASQPVNGIYGQYETVPLSHEPNGQTPQSTAVDTSNVYADIDVVKLAGRNRAINNTTAERESDNASTRVYDFAQIDHTN